MRSMSIDLMDIVSSVEMASATEAAGVSTRMTPFIEMIVFVHRRLASLHRTIARQFASAVAR